MPESMKIIFGIVTTFVHMFVHLLFADYVAFYVLKKRLEYEVCEIKITAKSFKFQGKKT